jgi:hypothetical protein
MDIESSAYVEHAGDISGKKEKHKEAITNNDAAPDGILE